MRLRLSAFVAVFVAVCALAACTSSYDDQRKTDAAAWHAIPFKVFDQSDAFKPYYEVTWNKAVHYNDETGETAEFLFCRMSRTDRAQKACFIGNGIPVGNPYATFVKATFLGGAAAPSQVINVGGHNVNAVVFGPTRLSGASASGLAAEMTFHDPVSNTTTDDKVDFSAAEVAPLLAYLASLPG